MRLIALLSIAMITLSGCAVSYAPDDAGDRSENTSSCTITQNGVTRDCSQPAPGPHGPKMNISTVERSPLTNGIDLSWSFAVHPGAQRASLWFAIDGYDGNDAGLQPDRGCVKLTGPVSKNTGNCFGSGNVNVAISGNVAHIEPHVVLEYASLPVGDYNLSAKIQPGAADYHLVIDIHY